MTIDRRDFLKAGAAAFTLPLVAGRLSARANPLSALSALGAAAQQADRILVVIRLDGGNDGLNTVLPLDQYDALSKARGDILIPAAKALKLSDTVGLHPAMPGLQKLYLDGKVKIVQAVGYPNHNQSHFRSTDIWFTASDYNQVLESGWLGRYLDGLFPGFPDGYPSADYPDPPALQIGSVLFTLLEGAKGPMGMALSDPASLYSLTPNGVDVAPDTPAGHELSFIRLMAAQTQKYGDSIRKAMAAAANKSTLYPAANPLADQLKAVARLIAGGLKTRIYVVSLKGFDTHADQVDGASGDTTVGGRHAVLLTQLSQAIAAFQDDLALLGAEDRVAGLTISEFGRRIVANASFGTDHGTASPLLVFGKRVNGGMLGKNPDIPPAATVQDNIPMQFDFRSVYSTLLGDWLGVTGVELQKIMLKDFPALPLVSTAGVRDPQGAPRGEPSLEQNYPNPFRGATQLRYELPYGQTVTLKLIDASGAVVRVLEAGYRAAGAYRQTLDASGLPPGAYVCRLEGERHVAQRTMSVLR
jgi:uncharacterized protein (DUF1501 family)